MAIETLVPNVLEALSNLTGSVGDVNNGVDTPDAVWLSEVDDELQTVARVEFVTPTGSPTVGVDKQKFRVWARRSTTAGGNDPQLQINLWENDSFVATVMALADVTSLTGELFEATWDATLLGTADGSLVELHVIGARSGGAPANRRTVEFDEFEWVVDYVVAGAAKRYFVVS